MFSLRTVLLAIKAYIDDSSQLHLVIRLSLSRVLLLSMYYQLFQPLPSRVLSCDAGRDPFCRDYNTRISSGTLASKYYSVSSIR